MFLFSKFSSALSSLHTVSFPAASPFLFFLSQFFFPPPSMVLFAPLGVFFMGDSETRRMRFWQEQTLKVVSSAAPGLF